MSVVGVTDVIQIDAGTEHNCALLSDGKAMCWGRNNYGQLGDGTRIDRSIAVYVADF